MMHVHYVLTEVLPVTAIRVLEFLRRIYENLYVHLSLMNHRYATKRICNSSSRNGFLHDELSSFWEVGFMDSQPIAVD